MTKSYEQQTFVYQGPINRNRVPGGIRTVKEKETLKKILKQHCLAGSIHKINTLSHYLFILLFI